MAKLEKLAIQGIRSFGPEESRRMEFCTPFTLIWGQNGCGKTTIIESLKYITTGEVPPGCGKGASFVHDPKIAKEPTVRGQIKLLFTSTNGERVVSSRTLEVTQKPSKLECKTLDATITHTGADGQKSSISSKCADFQAEMTSLLGVSKPILENVIFCHQEESNWPLDEGKKVKEKFDAIFNATKYIKVLDSIKKLRTEMKTKVKNMEETIEALKVTKQQAEQLRKELTQLQTQETSILSQRETLKNDMTPLNDRLKEILNLERNLGVIEGQLNGKKHQMESVKAIQAELKSGQSIPFECSDSDLLKMSLEFESNLQNQERRLQREEDALKQVERQIENAKKMESEFLQKLGRLEAQHKSHLQNLKLRNEFMKSLVSEHNISEYDYQESFNCEDCDGVLNKLSNNIDQASDKIREKKLDFSIKESSIQKEMDQLRTEEAALEQNILSHGKQLDTLKRNFIQSKQAVSRNKSDLASTDINELRNEIIKATEDIEVESSRIDAQAVEYQILQSKKELADFEIKLDDIKKKIAKLNKQSEVRSKYEINMKTKSELEQKVQFLKRKNADDFAAIFGSTIPDSLRSSLDSYMSNVRKQINSIRENIASSTRKKTELDMKIDNDKQTIKDKEKEITEFDDKLENICQGGNLTSAIDKIASQVEKLSKKEADKTCSSVVLKNYIEKLEEQKCCPLCHRDFENLEEADRLKEELEGKMTQIPDHLTQVKTTLQKLKKTHEQLLQLKPQEKRRLSSKQQIDQLKERVKENISCREKVNEEMEDAISTMEILQSEEEIARKVQPDIIIIEGHDKKIKDLTLEIKKLQNSVGGFGCDMTMDDLLKVQSELDEQIKNVRHLIEEQKSVIMEHKEKLQRLGERKVKLSSREIELSSKQMELEKLQEECTRLEKEKIFYVKEIEESKVKLFPLKNNMKDRELQKRKIVVEKEQWVDSETKKVENLRTQLRVAKDKHTIVKSYIESDAEDKLQSTQQRMQSINEQNSERDNKRKTIQYEITDIQTYLTNQREHKRSLDDERKIREKESELISLSKEIKVLQEKINSFNYDSMCDEKDELLRRESQIRQQRATLEGRLEELKKRQRELTLNLNSKVIRDAVKNYRSKLIEAKCTDVACNDLNKYYKALYTGIMKFHSEKMNTINKYIRELWRTTYRGNDIDYVEIKTDESEIKSADKRQSYNYRVIMVKNDAEMDMRGRCSAGQKVLASLIIRMALAETFSMNCGILALDEPTTNLDAENIKALSLALLNIVNRRSHQKNFQLIIITHDTEFLHALTRADSLEHFFEVSRNERGLSVIKKQDIALG